MAWVLAVHGVPPDVAIDVLDDVGADEIELADGHVPVGLFHASNPAVPRAAVLHGLRQRGHVGDVRCQPAERLDWASTWTHALRDICIGPLRIRPTRSPPEACASSTLWIEVGGAFGTGLHPTTHLCLEALVTVRPVGTVLDLGSGTGILALAALRLGATRAVGVDHDPEALVVSRRNAERAGLARAFEATDRIPSGLRADRVVANVLGASLIAWAPGVVGALARGGEVSLSGFPAGQCDEVSLPYVRLGMRIVARDVREGWGRVDLRAGW